MGRRRPFRCAWRLAASWHSQVDVWEVARSVGSSNNSNLSMGGLDPPIQGRVRGTYYPGWPARRQAMVMKENSHITTVRRPPYAGIPTSRCALLQAILRKTAGVVAPASNVRVSRATHLPRMRGATRSEFCAAPPPLPSSQLQSLPKCSLSWWRLRKSLVKAGSRDSALLAELAEVSAKRLG